MVNDNGILSPGKHKGCLRLHLIWAVHTLLIIYLQPRVFTCTIMDTSFKSIPSNLLATQDLFPKLQAHLSLINDIYFSSV